ncbi:MAG: phosphatase PAP2 family protein [Actinomyces succiniciruminis]|nr:phosphatase PAP2 family protein [Actinomyces succiniciruminis]
MTSRNNSLTQPPDPGRRAQRRSRLLAGVLAVVCMVGVALTWWLLVVHLTGQAMEQAALDGSRIGAHFVSDHARNLLHVVSLPAAIGLVLVVLVGARWRGSRRRALWAAGAVVAINISTQVLKYLILWRPDYGLFRKFGGMNTLPSGHTAVAASAAVALILVTGPRWRGVAAWAGAALAAAMGYSTLVCQWHRPGDVIAALLLATSWGAVAIACGAWADEAGPADSEPTGAAPATPSTPAEAGGDVAAGELPPARLSSAAVLGGLGILAGAAALMLEVLTWRGVVDAGGAGAVAAAQLSRTAVFIAYAAGAVGTVAVAGMGMAALALLTPRGVGQAGPAARA